MRFEVIAQWPDGHVVKVDDLSNQDILRGHIFREVHVRHFMRNAFNRSESELDSGYHHFYCRNHGMWGWTEPPASVSVRVFSSSFTRERKSRVLCSASDN